MEATNQSRPVKMSEKSENSRTRLLDAAEVLFANKGFEKTTVRDITTAAHCNVASINYHFQNKDNLYKEVYVRRVRQLRQARFAAIDQVTSRGREARLEELIGTYARSFLEPLVGTQSGQAVMMLMTREMNEPRLPKEIFFEEIHQANPQLPAPPETEAMIEHLVRFSSAGIRAFAGKGEGA
jgi:AcrR family transcriptional regulator